MSKSPGSKSPAVVWINVNLSLQCFAQPLLCRLSQRVAVGQWNYYQQQDQPCSLEQALHSLQSYLELLDQPVHLIGHGTGGLLGLLHARRQAATVKSLTLLSVGPDAAIDWQAHYYLHRPYLSRQRLLMAMVYNLFGYQEQTALQSLTEMLGRDLEASFSPHSLFQSLTLAPGGAPVPLLVCGSLDDGVVEPETLRKWQLWFKLSDRLWLCPQGRHFFHFFQDELLSEQLFRFWADLSVARPPVWNYRRVNDVGLDLMRTGEPLL